MTRLRTIATSTLLCVLVLSVYPPRVQAYLDPGTGSYLIQVLLAGLLGGLVAIKIFWRHISGFFGKLTSRGKPAESSPDEH
jgi:hypothetical protein